MSEQSSSDPPRGRHSDYFLETFPAAENFLVRYDNSMLVDRDSFDIGNVIEMNPKKFVERLTKIRDNKRDVLNAIEKLKGKLGMIDKDKLQKLINLYDDLAKQEEEYLCIFRQVFPRKIGSSDSLPGAVASSNASQSPASLSPGQQKHAEIQDPKQCNILEARSKMQNLMEEQRLFQGFCNSIMSRMEQLQMELKEFEQPNVVSNESLVSHVQALKQLEEKLKTAKLLCAQTVEASKQNNSGNDIDTELADYAHKLRIRKQYFDDLLLRFAELEQFTDGVKNNAPERSSSTWARPPSNNDNNAMEKTVSNDTRGFKDKELSLTFPDSWLRNYDSKRKYSKDALEGDSSRMVDSYTKAFREFERKYLLNDQADASTLKLHVNEGENSAGICSLDAGGGETANNCRSSECRADLAAAAAAGGANGGNLVSASVVAATTGGLSEKSNTDNLAKTIRRRIVEKLPLSGFKQSAQRQKGRIQHCNSSSSTSNIIINGGSTTTTTPNNNNNNNNSKQLRYDIPSTNDGGVTAVREKKLEKLKYYIDMIKKICDGMLEDAGDGCSHVPLANNGRADRSEGTTAAAAAELFTKNACIGCSQQQQQQQQQQQSLLLAVLNCQQQIQIQQQMEFTMLRKWFENSNSFRWEMEEQDRRRSSSEATAIRQRFHNEQQQVSDERRRCFGRKSHQQQRSRRTCGKSGTAESSSKHMKRVQSRLRRRRCCRRQSLDDLESSGLSVTASGVLQNGGDHTHRDNNGAVVHDRGDNDVYWADFGCCVNGGGDAAAAAAIGQPMTFYQMLLNDGQRYISEQEELIPYGEYLHQNNKKKMDENNKITSEKETKTPLRKCIPDLINAVISDALHNVMPFTKEFFNDMVEIMSHNQRLFSKLLSLLYCSDVSSEETKKPDSNVEEGVWRDKKYDLDEIFKFGRDVVKEMFDKVVELFGNENGGVIFEKPHAEILLARIKQKLENECEPNLVDKGVLEHLELQLPKLYGKTLSSCHKELRFIVQTIVVLWLRRRKLELDKLEEKEQHSPDVVMQMTTASFQPLSMTCGCENKLLVDDYAETDAVFFERKSNEQPRDKPSQDEDAEVAGSYSILEDVLGDWQLAEAENVVTNEGGDGISMFSDSPDELLYELNIQKRTAPSDKDESPPPDTGSFVSVDYVAVHPTRVRCTNTVTVQVPNNGQQAKSSVRLNEKKHNDEEYHHSQVNEKHH
ncbi:hypothetical protein T4A_11051 [Trichinella pseudospiralis]|uniref:Uncharacterized protein n=1 Tax=Trichinella pseudospiralis TaxID=6337 RepID=A0A0V1EZ23_TRIPS|nr:hypothetical protein T4A_11051 [Trichinella pseudospiralis]KRY78902.1 hypothetical protein T4A_11051 [Trichinella pseudospiralis]